jgi:pyruvate dehydrogenase E2 component (dihydrolipoamide acetyltransferase)
MADVAMPRLSDSMEEGTILKWLKSDGDEVKRGEELVEIETDKANMTYEADADGTLTIVAKEGDTLPVGEAIARIGDASRRPSRAATTTAGKRTTASASEEPDAEQEPGTGEEHGGEAPSEADEAVREQSEGPATAPRPQASGAGREPGAARGRRLRRGRREGRRRQRPRQGVARRQADGPRARARPGRPRGLGPRRRIVKADVEAAAKSGNGAAEEEKAPAEAEAPAEKAEAPKKDVPPAPVPARVADGGTAKGDVTVEELTRLQQVVARRMAESKATAPEFVLNTEVDMEEAVALRKQLKEMALSAERPAPSFNDMVIKACASRSATSRGRTAPTATGASSSTRASTSAWPSRGRTPWSCRRSTTPTTSRSARSPATPARWPSASARTPSPRPSSRAAPSPCRTSACSGSSRSPR